MLCSKIYKLKLTIVNMYQLSQEIEVWYIIPAIRKELARLLTQKYGMSFEKAGSILGISKAAVSQYLSNKRANKIKLNMKIKKEVSKSAKVMSENPRVAVSEIQRILKLMKETKCSCDVCKKYNKNVLGYCNCEPGY
jgi:predicted transcriptional regulator